MPIKYPFLAEELERERILGHRLARDKRWRVEPVNGRNRTPSVLDGFHGNGKGGGQFWTAGFQRMMLMLFIFDEDSEDQRWLTSRP
ncbi:hypothetical protein CEXT_507871 [Caerostris extrusa]|uniref:Uncharacterized protein n=1 Tax=Caerostris extrusa TaxID=172846 RepID=A0AAV4XCN5_CAEEX|nr:hypothetical protein CEXT_507871 [Caerostris extrusa]